jgi:hypothetical protein
MISQEEFLKKYNIKESDLLIQFVSRAKQQQFNS